MSDKPDLFDQFPDNAQVLPFNHEKGYGLCIRWSRKGIGCGEFVIGVHKENNEPFIDTEAMGPEFCASLMDLLKERGTLVTEAKFVNISPGLAVPDTLVRTDRP